MDLLRDHHQNDLVEIHRELKEVEKKSQKLKSKDSFDLRNKELGEYMERLNKNLTQSKNKKYEKDARAFHMGRAYRWQQWNLGNRSRHKYTRAEASSDHQLSTSGSETDGSSSDVLFTQSHAAHHSKNTTKKVDFNEGVSTSTRSEKRNKNYGGEGKSPPKETITQVKETNKKKDTNSNKFPPKITQMGETLMGPAASTRNRSQG